MSRVRFSPQLITGIILAIFFGIALYLRVYLPYEHVFGGDWIKFRSVDAYYHMRLVDNILHHFPQRLTFDPYTFYPHGTSLAWPPVFHWLLAGIAWLVGLGSPSQHIIDVVGVYFPTVLGALMVIPVYFIGKELFNRWAGWISAGLITFQPSFLGRSTLGYTDHHVAETLFTTVTILFLILAIKAAKERQLTFNHLKCRDWAIIGRPLIYSSLTGISLGIYLLTWVGGLLFILVILIYLVIQFIVDHLRDENTDYLAVIGTLLMLVTIIISLPLLPRASWTSSLYLPSFIIAILTPIALTGISHLVTNIKVKPIFYPFSIIGLGLVGLAIFHVVNPSLLKAMIHRFSTFTPSGAELTIHEVSPLLFVDGSFSLLVAWDLFTTGFYLSFVALGILIYHIVKQGSADKNLLVVWSLLMVAATLGQRRFSYYLAVNVALLTGYLSWLILEFASFKRLTAKSIKKSKIVKKKKIKLEKLPKVPHITSSHIGATLGTLVVFFLVFFPNISPAVGTAKHVGAGANSAWYEALIWLKENTPDPFGDPDAYYKLYVPPPPPNDYNYPESAYGIMCWWSKGHFITRIGHRIPISNPFQDGTLPASQFFTAQDEVSANKIMDGLGSKYVIIDYDTVTADFHAIPAWAGSSPEEFYEIYYFPLKGRLVPTLLSYPEYYQSVAARLYNFDGREVAAESPMVISYELKINPKGKPYKEIVSYKTFSSYEEAKVYVSRQKSANYRIVGTKPFNSPVPLDALEHYQLIYSSENFEIDTEIGSIPAVKIFEYVK